jgi:phosphonate transport system substrate-binding protein
VSESTIRAVQQAFVEMRSDREGKRILEQGAALLRLSQSGGFLAASDSDYENYRKFHREKLLKE